IAHADLADPERRHGDPLDQPYFDLYWTEPGREPLWILADGARAGFVLLNLHSPSGLGVDRAIAEFCIVPERRREGLGRAAALAALARTAGIWELQVYRANPTAIDFWRKVIAAADPKAWDEIPLAERIVHRFVLAPGNKAERAELGSRAAGPRRGRHDPLALLKG
ncbi:MAG TPA: GNAT family N-acetyltransferase, partial [Phenylobacterium sp.]|uniref:GNAT family N-acetyltransferase n=1 Tax=Phenylobacterium sp. TaxID=1871053 RepID=UPI002C9E72FE